MSDFISYYYLLKDRDQFRKSGTSHGSEFNYYDTPSHKYFKIFFHFYNGDSGGNFEASDATGLIAPTWLGDQKYLSTTSDGSYPYLHMCNSAWSYLKLNAETKRANMLMKFVNLLSNISAESPWYFSEISGLDAAIERKQTMVDNFTIDAARHKISIKCLPDAFDDRIGTLLDLYRAITWSWSTKRMILPANLRKFDMGVFVFETAARPHHVREPLYDSGLLKNDENWAGIGIGQNITSYKYIELHNCEIDYSSSKQLVTNLNNKDGFQPEYTIDIHFDDCYETRFNEQLMEEIGDMILFDTYADDPYRDNVDPIKSANTVMVEDYYENIKQFQKEDLFDWYRRQPENDNRESSGNSNNRLPDYDNSRSPENDNRLPGNSNSRLPNYPKPPILSNGGFLSNMINQVVSVGQNMITSVVKRALLGNLYTFSLTRIGDQLATLANGDILSTARNAAEYIRDAKQRKANQLNNLNIFEDDKVFVTAEGPMGTFNNSDVSTTKKRIIPKVKYIGNLYEGNTIANNI